MDNNSTEIAMLKALLLATALLSSSAFAYDPADRDAPLGRLVDRPNHASVIQYAPRVVYVAVPSSEPVYQPPVVCGASASSDQPLVISQPPQTASLRHSK